MPLISVIIPAYNHRDYILAALESVFAQTFTDYEVIVVNDGSPDDTAAVLRPLIESGKIRYIEQPNAGQAAARNRGISAARGSYIALLDDDDLWEPDKLAWQAQALRERPDAVLAYGQMRTFGQGLYYISPEPNAAAGKTRDDFVERVWINSPGQTLIRADALRAAGGFDRSIWGADDWDLYLNLAGRGPFLYLPRIALNYRYHSTNASKDVRRLWINARRVADKHFGRDSSRPDAARLRKSRQFIRQFISEDCFLHADYHARQGNLSRAGDLLRLAVCIRPIRNCKRAVKAWLAYRHPRRERYWREHLSLLRRRLSPHRPA